MMRAVVQLVKTATVTVNGQITGRIDEGLVVLLGIHRDDTEKDAFYLADKTANLRIFPDENKLMNRSLLDINGELLVVSQFTLFGDCRKGRRPSYAGAAAPALARELYGLYIKAAQDLGISVATGEFQAMMEVTLVNNGPVTVLLDSAKLF